MRVLSQDEIDALLSKILINPTVLPNAPDEKSIEGKKEQTGTATDDSDN